MEGYNYDMRSRTTKIEDISTDETNREILRWLKENNPDFDELVVCSTRDEDNLFGDSEYCPKSANDMGWLGYFIGQNTTLRELELRSFEDINDKAIETFCAGVNINRSIKKIAFSNMDLSGGDIFQSLRPFFENNSNLSKVLVERCQFGAGCVRRLSLILRGCNKSLESVSLSTNEMGNGEQLTEIIEALSAHPQLTYLRLWRMNIETNECTALSTLLLHTTTELYSLDLRNNDIDDVGLDTLAGALTNSSLSDLTLSDNQNITLRGWQSLSALLKTPNSNLVSLYLDGNSIGNEGARIFANALAANRTLKILVLDDNGITTEGYSSFAKILCDTSSISATFLSNHTLKSFGFDEDDEDDEGEDMPAEVSSSLALNECSDKTQVAMKKILKHHHHFDMQPFFEWDLKVLPIASNWFDRARSLDTNDEAGIDKRKLSAIYQFIRAMPTGFEPAQSTGG